MNALAGIQVKQKEHLFTQNSPPRKTKDSACDYLTNKGGIAADGV
jgi:hypothetical protein